MTNSLQRGLWMGALLLTTAAAFAQPTTLNFQVDMSAQLNNNTFNPPAPQGTGTDGVWVNGTFNGWSGGVQLSWQSGTVWGVTVADADDATPGQVDYKFSDSANWEDPLGASGNGNQNRVSFMPSTSGQTLTLPYCFFSDAGPVVPSAITFQVDMAEQQNLQTFTNGISEVFVAGFFGSAANNNWNEYFQLFPNTDAFVTNNGNITSMPYTNTLTTSWGCLGEVSDFKYIFNNEDGAGDHWESPSAANGDSGNGSGNRFVVNYPQTLPLVNFSDQAFAPVVRDTITFVVDMSLQVYLGAYTNGVSTAPALRGDPSINNWGETYTTEEAAPNTNYYSVNVNIVGAPGQVVQFKYYLDDTSDWESPAYANQYNGDGNRYITLPATSQSLNSFVYWDDEGLPDVTPGPCLVTFTVDMSPALTNPAVQAKYEASTGGIFTPGTDFVAINGIYQGYDNSWWTWEAEGGGGYQMTPIGGNLYSITLPVNAAQALEVQYKYSIDGYDDEGGFADNHYRYIRSLINSGSGYVMPTDLFAQNLSSSTAEQSFGNLAAKQSGTNVSLSWLGRTTVELQQTSSLNRPVTWTSLPLSDGTNLIVTPGNQLQGVAAGGALGTNVSTNFPATGGPKFYRLISPL
jgi:hypothetical protein